MNLMFAPLKRYVDFQGRSRRTEYWLWFLFQVIVSIIFGIAKSTAGAGSADVIKLVNGIFSLAIFLPTLAVGVRRLHDTNRTGWWIVFPVVVMIVGFIAYLATAGSAGVANLQKLGELESGSTPQQVMDAFSNLSSMLWVFVAYVAAALLLLVFDVLDGTPGVNRFGPDPKGRGGNINVF